MSKKLSRQHPLIEIVFKNISITNEKNPFDLLMNRSLTILMRIVKSPSLTTRVKERQLANVPLQSFSN